MGESRYNTIIKFSIMILYMQFLERLLDSLIPFINNLFNMQHLLYKIMGTTLMFLKVVRVISFNPINYFTIYCIFPLYMHMHISTVYIHSIILRKWRGDWGHTKCSHLIRGRSWCKCKCDIWAAPKMQGFLKT